MGEKKQIDRVARRVARIIMASIVVIIVILVATNWDWFTAPIPQNRYGVVGQLLGGSAATALIARVVVITVMLAIFGSILGLMFRGQLLSRFWQTEAESAPPTEPLESMQATDVDVDARLEGVEDAVKNLIAYEKQQQEDDDNP